MKDGQIEISNTVIPVEEYIKNIINTHGFFNILKVFREMLKNNEYNFEGDDDDE